MAKGFRSMLELTKEKQSSSMKETTSMEEPEPLEGMMKYYKKGPVKNVNKLNIFRRRKGSLRARLEGGHLLLYRRSNRYRLLRADDYGQLDCRFQLGDDTDTRDVLADNQKKHFLVKPVNGKNIEFWPERRRTDYDLWRKRLEIHISFGRWTVKQQNISEKAEAETRKLEDKAKKSLSSTSTFVSTTRTLALNVERAHDDANRLLGDIKSILEVILDVAKSNAAAIENMKAILRSFEVVSRPTREPKEKQQRAEKRRQNQESEDTSSASKTAKEETSTANLQKLEKIAAKSPSAIMKPKRDIDSTKGGIPTESKPKKSKFVSIKPRLSRRSTSSKRKRHSSRKNISKTLSDMEVDKETKERSQTSSAIPTFVPSTTKSEIPNKTTTKSLEEVKSPSEEPESTSVSLPRRNRLPKPMGPPSSIIEVLTNRAKGHRSMPIGWNYPLGMLQTLCEELSERRLLIEASREPTELRRMELVGAFAFSCYTMAVHRKRKPFNPLLGETFQWTEPSQDWRFHAEQVSHHPPISAAHCESTTWGELWQTFGHELKMTPLAAFRRMFPVQCNYHTTLRLNTITGKVEWYQWNKANSTLVMKSSNERERYVSIEGVVTINCNDGGGASGHTCRLLFNRSSGTSRENVVEGTVYDPSFNEVRHFEGDCYEGLWRVVNGVRELQPFFRPTALPRDAHLYYGLSALGMELNDPPKAEERMSMPPTDSRLRPDQRLFEEGRMSEASPVKNRLESAQRERRQDVADGRIAQHQPLWFKQTNMGPVFGERNEWICNRQYWRTRETQFGNVHFQDIFKH